MSNTILNEVYPKSLSSSEPSDKSGSNVVASSLQTLYELSSAIEKTKPSDNGGDSLVKIQIALELFQASVLKNQTLDENTQDLILKIIMSIPESPAALIAAMRQMAKTQKLSANSEEQIRKFEKEIEKALTPKKDHTEKEKNIPAAGEKPQASASSNK